ncbi:hypothetical protein RI367_002455 [Sorochytrium milnesiophthora]
MPCHCALLRDHDGAGAGAGAGAGGGDGFALSDAQTHYAPHRSLEPVHIDMTLRFDIQHARLTATVVHTFRSVASAQQEAAAPLLYAQNRRIRLNALAFQDVQCRGEQLQSFEYDGEHIDLEWASVFAQGEERKVAISYTVERPIAGLYFSHPDLAPDTSYAGKGTYVITDHETERCRHWLPCVDFPTVRTTLAFHITAPQHMVAVANGRLVGEDSADNNTDGGWKTTHYALDYPCPSYLLCLAVGEFEQVDDGTARGAHGDIPLRYLAVKGTPHGDIRRAFDQTPGMIKWLSEKLNTPFPWPKYFQIAAPDIGGAMENISLVTWTDMFLMDERMAKDWKFVTDTVNIHEMAHTYFGDMTVIRHFEHVWLKESWATYMESVWVDDHHGADWARWYLHMNARGYMNETKRYMRPIVCRRYDSSWSLFDGHTYPGGAVRIHMLRRLLGDAVFWPAVGEYLHTYQRRTVETDDFRRVMETRSGLNLNQFFDQWFHSKGYPRVRATLEYDRATQVATVTLEQTQVDKDGGVGLFAMSVDVEFVVGGGGSSGGDKDGDKSSDKSTTPKRLKATAHFDGRNTKASVSVRADSKPTLVEIDADGKLLLEVSEYAPGEDILLNTARDGRDLVNRLSAYQTLIKKLTYGTAKKLGAILEREPFFGVRGEVAKALAAAHNPYATQLLADLVRREQDAMALKTVLQAAKVRDERVRGAVQEVLARDDLSYLARSAALQALGMQRHDDDLQYLIGVASDNSMVGQHGLVRAGAFAALGAHRSLGALEHLLSRVANNKTAEHDGSRAALFAALVAIVPYHERRYTRIVVDHLVGVLGDRNDRVHLGAVSGLVALEARDKIGAIQASLVRLPAQAEPMVRKQLNKLREAGAGESDAGKVAKRLEDIETKLQQLEDKWSSREALEERQKELKKQETTVSEGDAEAKEGEDNK